MNSWRSYLLLALLGLALVGGCNRGNEPALIGKSAPDFTLQDGTKSVSLHDYRGKTVVLNFWATWCPPCVDEMPSLLAMQDQLKDRGVVVLAVSEDADPKAFADFVRDNKMEKVVAIRDAKQKVGDLYGTYRYPETYIIDRNGTLQKKIIGPANWTDGQMIEYLSKL